MGCFACTEGNAEVAEETDFLDTERERGAANSLRRGWSSGGLRRPARRVASRMD